MNDERQRIIERVQKLFALAGQNDSPEEAQLAASRAQEFLQKYDLSLSEVEIKREGSSLCGEQRITLKTRTAPTWVKFLHATAAEGFGVEKLRALRVSDSVLIYIGVEPDVTIAKQTFEYLYQFIVAYDLKGKTTKQKNEWRTGFVHAVHTRFEEQNKQRAKDTHISAVVLAKEQIAKHYISQKYQDVQKARKMPVADISRSFHEGIAAGMAVPINRPLESNG